LYAIEDGFFFNNRAALSKLALKARLPAIYAYRTFVDAGGLMSYGPDLDDQVRRSVGCIDNILKGAQPADLPIEQPTQSELIINLKTTKALGITIPQSVLARANAVIR
jgi:putative ABC transport system substrate-binding protein